MHAVVFSHPPPSDKRLSAKAQNLTLLDRLGLTPSFVVIHASVLQDDADAAGARVRIESALRRVGIFGKAAVRSASWIEDGDGRSAAGILDSFLNVSLKEVFDAIERCRASAGNGRVARYLSKRNETGGLLPTDVIVQMMIPPSVKGHIYSQLHDQDLLYIEHEEAGRKGSETFFMGSWAPGTLPEAILTRIRRGCDKLRREFPSGADIEFVVNKKKVWFVQARPLSKGIKYAVVPLSIVPPVSWDGKAALAWMSGFSRRMLGGEMSFYSYSGRIFCDHRNLRDWMMDLNLTRQRRLIARAVKYFSRILRLRRSSQRSFLAYEIINHFFMRKGVYLFKKLKAADPQAASELGVGPCSHSYTVEHFLRKFKSSAPDAYAELRSRSESNRRRVSRRLKAFAPENRPLARLFLDLLWCKDYMNFFQLDPLFQPPAEWTRREGSLRGGDLQQVGYIVERDFAGEALIIGQRKELVDGAGRGKVVVSRDTWPWQLPTLLECNGIIAEKPGQASHAAMIARELSIPFVSGAKGILKKVRNGDRVSVVRGQISIRPGSLRG